MKIKGDFGLKEIEDITRINKTVPVKGTQWSLLKEIVIEERDGG